MNALRAYVWLAGKLVLQLVLGVLLVAACAAPYVVLWFLWPIPLSGHALWVAHRNVCAVTVEPGPKLLDDRSIHVVRFIRTRGESVDLLFGDTAPLGPPPSADLLAVAELLARTARVPLRSLIRETELGTRVSTT